MDVENTQEIEATILTLAKSIGETQTAYSKVRLSASIHQADLEARKLFLTPIGGWDGKNEGERKTSAESTFAGDKVCQALRETLTGEATEMSKLEGSLGDLEAQRRGLEWVITYRLVNALKDKWDGLNPGRVLASKIGVMEAREAALDELPSYLDGVKRSGDITLTGVPASEFDLTPEELKAIDDKQLPPWDTEDEEPPKPDDLPF